jgi:hypothetical protein
MLAHLKDPSRAPTATLSAALGHSPRSKLTTDGAADAPCGNTICPGAVEVCMSTDWRAYSDTLVD